MVVVMGMVVMGTRGEGTVLPASLSLSVCVCVCACVRV